MPRPRVCRRFTKETAELVLKVHAYFKRERDEKQCRNVRLVAQRTADACGIGVRTLTRLLTPGYIEDMLHSGEIEVRNRPSTIAGPIQEMIRSAYFDLREEGIRPSLRVWMVRLEQNLGRPLPFSLRTFWKCLFKMGFVQKAIKNETHIREKESVILQRHRYLQLLLRYRREERLFYWQDESWINKNLTEPKEWVLPGEVEGTCPPSGKGARSILCGVGSDVTGWLPDSFLIFRGSKSSKSSDYHSEINSDVFLDWIEKKVIPKLPNRAVLVIDRASYHLVRTPESTPAPCNATKNVLLKWLHDKDIVDPLFFNEVGEMMSDDEILERPSNGGVSLAQLQDICNTHRPEPVYLIYSFFSQAKHDLKLLILLVHHPELNPIESMWARLKSYAYRNNTTFSLPALEQHVRDEYERVTPSDWSEIMQNIKDNIESKYIKRMDEFEQHDTVILEDETTEDEDSELEIES